ncbi:hypothetical protein Sgly_1100 [Syntrophobotulus glycolicus DSM 8271]|uniref:Plasmid stabilization system n=1 Tax=Syntrophobotulus glycolicus (strain DSM 8271 / FlGlyR) TaxID=645991 RepID=F0SU42_SYNGF|nr:hypothetical protein [Syntrophobotulus glycolicus]ADY55425.1 hypothetical protein Sgly_1100 [Syntrophobotulus glycolicus DSM 8271]
MPTHKFSVQVSDAAYGRMYSHVEFLARVSVAAAERLYLELEKALVFLEDSPKSCPVYIPQTPIDAELRYKLFSGRYHCVFEIIGDAVYVYDIQDCRQDTDKSLL